MSVPSDLEADFVELHARWLSGTREREDMLQLLFLSWWHWAEPPFVTGLSEDRNPVSLWKEIFAYFGGVSSNDPEFLHVAALMVHLFPFVLGDEDEWNVTAERLKQRALDLHSEGFGPEAFEGRGEFGEYFAHQAQVNNGTPYS